MKITYKLNKDIVARTAANLVFNLSEIKSIHIAKGNTCFNGKSLVGILSNNLLSGDIINLEIEELSDVEKVKEIAKEADPFKWRTAKEIFNEVGRFVE